MEKSGEPTSAFNIHSEAELGQWLVLQVGQLYDFKKEHEERVSIAA